MASKPTKRYLSSKKFEKDMMARIQAKRAETNWPVQPSEATPEPAAPVAPAKKVRGRPFPKKPGPTGIPNFVAKKEPEIQKTTLRKTRSGKKIDKTTGKVVVPKVGRLVSTGEGTVKKVTPEDVAAARTTVLPVAGPKPESKPEGRMSLGANPIKKGFSVAFPVVEKATKAALGHLSTMNTSHPDTPEHKEAKEAFHLIHANIGQMSPELHVSLAQAHHEITHPSDKTPANLALIHKAIGSRLSIGRAVHTDNLKRAIEGNPK